MEWYYIAAMAITAILGILAGLFGEKYAEGKRLARLIVEIIEDKNITDDQVARVRTKVRKIFGREE